MTRLAGLLGLVLAGWLFASVASLEHLSDATGYLYATSALLAVGLYGSTYGIDLPGARRDRRLIMLAVTVGVLLKAVLIGGALALAFRDPLFLILGVVVSQIDPLSVAAIMGDQRMSPRARTILAAWASFDDPVSLVLAVYATAVATVTFGLGQELPQGLHVGTGLWRVFVDLAANLLFAAVAYGLWRAGGRDRWRWWAYALLAAVAVVAVWQFLMLGLAIAGLFLRPAGINGVLPRLTQWALAAAALLLGALLVGGVRLGAGAALGAAAFLSQIVAALVLARALPGRDRFHLALAQQNGITAVILALRLEAQFVGVVAVVAPAILTTNALYLVANPLADRVAARVAARRRRRAGPPRPAPAGITAVGLGNDGGHADPAHRPGPGQPDSR
ncbi:MAG TPA: hypothetical protein VES42_08415 [Pilimelia sp.]|nr:hypothetical protein [Pilimelia sp.]